VSATRALRGGYVLGTEAARGAMGSVMRATAPDGRPVAAKRLLDIRHASRFAIEAQVLQALDHPRIVRILDLVEDPSGSYLIMEWVEGTDLGALLRAEGDPGLPADRVLDWTLQAADGLAYVHEQQTVHRDVKPQNLMLSPDRGIVVVDFGIASPAAAGGTREIGTPGFMAPETYEGVSVTPRTDVYGLAATAWTLLAGSPPSLGAREELTGATFHLTSALRSALAIDPRERTPSMAAFATSLGGRIHSEDGRDMAVAVDDGTLHRPLLQGVVRTVAGIFEAAASSLALLRPGGDLVYVAAWGAGADELVGRALPAGAGIVGRAIARRAPQLVPDVHADADFAASFAAQTGYEPTAMMVVPLIREDGRTVGALTLLDRRDGRPYDVVDLGRARLFAELALDALVADAEAARSLTFDATTYERG
jgi:hypothetical protein